MAVASGHRAPRAWRQALVLCAIALLILSPDAVDAKKKSKKAKGPKKIRTTMPAEEVCEACNATIQEMNTHIQKNKNRMGFENSISDASEVVCSSSDYMKTWKFYPPKMKKGCQLMLDNHEEKLHTMFYEKAKPQEIWDALCAIECEGVDTEADAAGDPSVTVHGNEGVKVMNADGKPLETNKDKEDL